MIRMVVIVTWCSCCCWWWWRWARRCFTSVLDWCSGESGDEWWNVETGERLWVGGKLICGKTRRLRKRGAAAQQTTDTGSGRPMIYTRVVFVSLGGGRGDVAEMMHCLVIISMMVVMVWWCIDNVIYSGSSQKLTSRDLTQFAHHVARGMEYLSSKKVRLYLWNLRFNSYSHIDVF